MMQPAFFGLVQETSGSSEVEAHTTNVIEDGDEGKYKPEDGGNSDIEFFDFELSDEDDYLLSYVPNELAFYDQKHGRICRRNGGRKLSVKAKSKTSGPQNGEQKSLPSSKHNVMGGNGVCSANKELRIKEMRIENSKRKKESKTKAKKVRDNIKDEPVATRRGANASCLKKTSHESVNHPAKPPTFYNNSDFVLSSGNSVKFDDQAYMNLLIELQDRDITPEDYDVLMQLDASVKPKTLSEAQIESLRSDTVTSILDDVCSVCMEDYTPGEVRKFLPCGHYFHGQCIRTWLSWTSNRCPIDGKEVR